MSRTYRGGGLEGWRRVRLCLLLAAGLILAEATGAAPVAARGDSFPSLTQQRELFRQWRQHLGSTLWNDDPELAESLGEQQYPAADAPSAVRCGATQFYELSEHSAPQTFVVVSAVTSTVAGKSSRARLLVAFSRASGHSHWKVTTALDLSQRPDLGRSGRVVPDMSRAQIRKLAESPEVAERGVLAASNQQLQQGVASALVPDPAWYLAESNWLETIVSENGSFNSESALAGYPDYTISQPAGGALTVFTFSVSNTENEGEGFWLNTAFFPGELLLTQSDTWLWTVAVEDPPKSARRPPSIAGFGFAPISAVGTTTLGEVLTFGPW